MNANIARHIYILACLRILSLFLNKQEESLFKLCENNKYEKKYYY